MEGLASLKVKGNGSVAACVEEQFEEFLAGKDFKSPKEVNFDEEAILADLQVERPKKRRKAWAKSKGTPSAAPTAKRRTTRFSKALEGEISGRRSLAGSKGPSEAPKKRAKPSRAPKEVPEKMLETDAFEWPFGLEDDGIP